MIPVTQPFLPPLDEFNHYLEKIWKNKWLTNNGEFHQEFEQKLCEYLGVSYISLFTNGTLALITALQALDITGEVITTPFSFVASTHAIWWNGIKPVFVDIESNTFTLDPDKIEAAITNKTTAILPVHVYGNPCNIDAIQKIAAKHSLKVIYDAAHAFGVRKDGISIAQYGDLSVLSFHATKVFNTFEGGAIICHDEKTKRRIDDLKNFGIHDETTVVTPGINAKMNEFQAALGILQLQYIDSAIEKRKALVLHYRTLLQTVTGIYLLNDLEGITHNYSYFPIIINSKLYGKTRDELFEYLIQQGFHARRYFYPLISQFPPYKDLESSRKENLPIADTISKNIICLPLYPDLSFHDVETICGLLKGK